MRCIDTSTNKLQARCINTCGPKTKKTRLPFAKKLDNDVITCVVKNCSKLVWTFNLEKHIQDKHSDIAPEAVSKLLEETSKNIESFKTTALARLVKAQAKVPRKKKKRDEEEDPTFTPGMQLTVSTIVQRSCYLQGRIA